MNPQQNDAPDNTPDVSSSQPQAFGQPQSAQVPTSVVPDASVQQPVSPVAPTEQSYVSPTGLEAANAPGVPSPAQPQVFGPQQSVFPNSDTHAVQPSAPVSGPVPVSQAQISQGAPAADKPKRRVPGKKLLVAVIAVLLVGIGGSAFAYINIMNNSPEKVLADALANTMKDVLDRKPIQLVSNIKLESKDQSMPYSVVVDLDAKQANDNGEVNTTVQMKVGPQFDISVSGSVITEGTEAVYVRLNDLQKTVNEVSRMTPEAAALAANFKPLIQKIDGQWIKIDEKSLANYGLVESEEEIDKCAQALDNLRISDGDKKRLKEIFKNNQFAIASEELPAETVDGDSSYHYKLDLNEEAGIRFAKDFVELESLSNVKTACEINPEDIEKELDNLQDSADTEENAKPIFELWVSKKNRYPTKVKVTVADKEASMDWVTNTKINAEDTKIDIPANAMSLEELETEIKSALQTNAPQGMTRGWSSWQL